MQCDIALYGAGVMGASLAKNMIAHGFSVAVYSKDLDEVDRFSVPEKEDAYLLCRSEAGMVQALKRPRKIFLMITAGKPVDMVLKQLLPLLDAGDVIMDGGNSYYRDTNRRYKFCKEKGIHFLGVGVSGGEKGALEGPSIMPGGSREGWEKSKEILMAIAAKKEGIPCCGFVAAGGAGHYVKMVHNGIEYGILELFAESYHVLRFGMGFSQEEIISIFESWQGTGLTSYLLDASLLVMRKKEGQGYLLDKISDVAGQKGTGKWTLQESIERGVYAPTIYEAVMARTFSQKLGERKEMAENMPLSDNMLKNVTTEDVSNALYYGMATTFSQGIELIHQASVEEGWDIQLDKLVALWKAGCIIRCQQLDKLEQVFENGYQIPVFAKEFSKLQKMEVSVENLVCQTEKTALSIPGISSSLQYMKYYRTKRMPIYFIQGLRDCFGAHTYERTDKPGSWHTQWER